MLQICPQSQSRTSASTTAEHQPCCYFALLHSSMQKSLSQHGGQSGEQHSLTAPSATALNQLWGGTANWNEKAKHLGNDEETFWTLTSPLYMPKTYACEILPSLESSFTIKSSSINFPLIPFFWSWERRISLSDLFSRHQAV